MSPPPLPPPFARPLERKHRYSFRLSVQELQVTSHIRKLFVKPTRLIFIVLPAILTIIISVLIIHSRHYIKDHILRASHTNSTRLFEFCVLYDNRYYANIITLPLALAIIVLIVLKESRITNCPWSRCKRGGKFSIYTPIPFNPFSKVNRMDTMILCGIVSHEILQIIEEIFLKTTQMSFVTLNGPLFDLLRQIGLVIIIGMRYYPIYTVVEMPDANVLYYALSALYMWIDFVLRIIEQSYCVNVGPLIKAWHRFQQFKNEMAAKLTTTTPAGTTLASHSDYRDYRSDGMWRQLTSRLRPMRPARTSPTTVFPSSQVSERTDHNRR